ncbi:MAG: hypothetical protein ACRDY1_09875 [Acidimicrobiales bacterium]
MAITQRELTKRSLFSRAGVRESALVQRRRLLGDRADYVASSIFVFENRDTEGDSLEVVLPDLSETEVNGRFAAKFSRRLRGLFHDLRAEDLVDDDELPLFYWPQSSEARIRLALRLRYVALIVRQPV